MANRIVIQCAVCGQDFPVRPSLMLKRKTCSKACMGISASRRYKEFGTKKTPVEDRFWPKVDKTPGQGPNGDCWTWTGKKNRSGYGLLYKEGKNKMYRAHVLAYTMTKGPIPEGLCVCHECDTPSCVRADHLWLGTLSENFKDMIRKGRHNPGRGGSNGLSKLSIDQVKAIISDVRPRGIVAEEYGISPSTVTGIRTRKRWIHVQV